MTVPETSDTRFPAVDRRYWVVLIARAAVAAVIAIVITFSADHSPAVGYLTFGAFAVACGLVALLGGFVARQGIDRGVTVAIGIADVAVGIIALVSVAAGVAFLLFLIGVWAAVTGALELYLGARARGRVEGARDLVFAGALTVLLALVAVLLPPGFSQTFTGPDGIERVLSSSVIMVGAFGAYAAILGVYLAIGAFSLKWSVAAEPATSEVHG